MNAWAKSAVTFYFAQLVAVFFLASVHFSAAQGIKANVVAKWARFEHSFQSKTSYKDPFSEVTLTVLFSSPAGEIYETRGFWDGGKTWRVRFSPDQLGRWTFRTICSDAANRGLHNLSGAFVCTVPGGSTRFALHGPVQVARDHGHFEHADGTPFFWMADLINGAVCTRDREEWEFYARTRAEQNFSVVEIVLAARQMSQQTQAGLNYSIIDPKYFQDLERKLELLQRAGILCALIPELDPTPTQRGSADSDQQARWLDYLVARFGAEPIAWVLKMNQAGKGWGSVQDQQNVESILCAKARCHRPVIARYESSSAAVADATTEKWADALELPGVADRTGEPSKDSVRPMIVIAPSENSVVGSGKRINADELRRAVYWSVLAGAPAGISYSAVDVEFRTEPGVSKPAPVGRELSPWEKSLFLPGAKEMGYLSKAMGVLQYWRLRPHPELIVTQPGNTDLSRFIAAAESELKDLSLIYVPEDRVIEITLEGLPPSPKITWLNPRTGLTSPAVAVLGATSCQFPTPDAGDWLLMMKSGK